MLCYATLCYAMLCYAMLCYAMLSYYHHIILCNGMLYHIISYQVRFIKYPHITFKTKDILLIDIFAFNKISNIDCLSIYNK